MSGDNTVRKENKVSESEKFEKEKVIEVGLPEEQYVIINYLIKHTGVLFTCISALLAILSFIFKYAFVLYNKAYLDYWNVDIVYMSNRNDMFLYTILSTFVYSILLVIFNYVMNKTVLVYEYYIKYLSYFKYKIKELKKESRTSKKELKRICKKVKNTSEENKTTLIADKNRHERIIYEIDNKIPKLNNYLKKAKLEIARNLILTFFIAYAVIVTATSLVSYNSKIYESIGVGKLIFAILAFGFILYLMPAKLNTRWKKISKNQDFVYDLESGNYEIENKAFPIQFLFHPTLEMFTNGNIVKSVIMVVVTSLLMLAAFREQGIKDAVNKQEYMICSGYSDTYVVVYNNSESIVLAKAIVNDDYINIYTSEQKVVPANDITYEVRTFEKDYVSVHDLDKSIKSNK